jgi:hypothetical protein
MLQQSHGMEIRHRDKGKLSTPDEITGVFNRSILSSLNFVLGVDSSLTEMSTQNLSEGKGWPARKADDLTAICEPIV